MTTQIHAIFDRFSSASELIPSRILDLTAQIKWEGPVGRIFQSIAAHYRNASSSAKFTVLLSLVLALPFLPHSKPRPVLPTLPVGVERVFITAGDGKGSLELLVARPSGDGKQALAPLLLVHGGYGSAFCWKNWIPYFADQGRTVYALSLSGHGTSTRPAFYTLRPKSFFAKDVLAAVEYIASHQPGQPPLLVGHSAGGGLSQYVVDVHGASLRAKNQISGVIGVSPFPPHGGFGVYVNWFKLDPWLIFRTFIDPYLLLSTPRRSSRAFFGEHYCSSLHSSRTSSSKHDTVPEGYIQQMTTEESVGWPSSMVFPFVNAHRVLRNMTYVGGTFQTRIHLIAGRQDKLMSPAIMRRAQSAYGCGLDLVDGAGHHLMLDVPWREGAEFVEKKVREWGL